MNKNEHLLTILTEECGEVIKEVTKSLRFGLNDHPPYNNKTNKEKLESEIADLYGVVELLVENNIISEINVVDIFNKKAKVAKWMSYSENIGTLVN